MYPAISINTLCLAPDRLEAQLGLVAAIGVSGISPEIEQVTAMGAKRAARLIQDAGLSAALLTHRAFGFDTPARAAQQCDRLKSTIDVAHAIGASAICLTSGSRGTLLWPDALQRFASEIQPCAEYAQAAGIALGLEPTSHLYADVSIAHRLSDALTLARAAGINVGIDLFACWADSDIETAIADAGPITAFVQVSDYVLGDRALPCRAVPGDGDIPLDHLLQLILGTGFCGPIDIEIIGPRLETEGRAAGLKRAISYLREKMAGN
jgi:sugar phosphate isomerase/epimerase